MNYLGISGRQTILGHFFLRLFTAPFNNMRTLNFKAQPTNAFFATVNQMFGGSSQLRAHGYQFVEHSSDNETVLGSSRKLGAAA